MAEWLLDVFRHDRTGDRGGIEIDCRNEVFGLVPDRVDLAVFSYTESGDLTASKIALSNPSPCPGETVAVYGTFVNSGERVANGVPVEFRADDISFASDTVSGPVAPGGKITVEASWTVPEQFDDINRNLADEKRDKASRAAQWANDTQQLLNAIGEAYRHEKPRPSSPVRIQTHHFPRCPVAFPGTRHRDDSEKGGLEFLQDRLHGRKQDFRFKFRTLPDFGPTAWRDTTSGPPFRS